jgi:uncharacterized protein YbaP (TraB family)
MVTDSKSETTNEGNECNSFVNERLKTKLSNENKRIAELEDRVKQLEIDKEKIT